MGPGFESQRDHKLIEAFLLNAFIIFPGTCFIIPQAILFLRKFELIIGLNPNSQLIVTISFTISSISPVYRIVIRFIAS